MRNLILLQLILILLSCGRESQMEARRRRLEAMRAAEMQALEREFKERLAQIPPFIDLGDTVNFTDENGWKQRYG